MKHNWTVFACMRAQSCPTFCDPCTVAHHASLSMEFSRQEYWSGLSFPTPRDLPRPRDQTRISCVSCISRWILHYCVQRQPLACPIKNLPDFKNKKPKLLNQTS